MTVVATEAAYGSPRPVNSPPRLSKYVAPLSVSFVVTLMYAWASVQRYERMHAGIDLAIFTEAAKRYSSGNAPWSSIKSQCCFNLLGDHFSPVTAALGPLYAVAPDARTLLVAQAGLIGITAGIVTAVARRHLNSHLAAIALGLAYGAAWDTQAMALFDFHEIAFALPLLALACAAVIDERPARACQWAAPLMLVKEDSVFLLLGLALALAAQRSWKYAAALAAYAVASFALIVGVAVPHFSFYGTYTYWSSSAADGGALTSLLAAFTSGDAVVLVAMLLLSSFGLAVRSPLVLAVLPSLASRLTSPNETYWGLSFHYNATITVILAVALIDGLRRLQQPPDGRRVSKVPVPAVAVACALLAVAVSYQFPLGATMREASRPCPDCWETRHTLSSIPPGSTVAADDELAAYLVDDYDVHQLKPGLLDSTGRPLYPRFFAMTGAIGDCLIASDDWRRDLLLTKTVDRTYNFYSGNAFARDCTTVTPQQLSNSIAVYATQYAP